MSYRWFAVGLVAVSFSVASAADLRKAPIPVPPQHVGVGRMVPPLKAQDLDRKSFDLAAYVKDHPATVVAFTSTTCPVSKKYLPVLARLAKDYADKKVGLVLIAPIASDAVADLRSTKSELGLTTPILVDKDGRLARALGAKTTGDVFLIDDRQTVVYRGAIDDQYGVGYSRETPTDRYLIPAIEALLVNQPIRIAATTAPGCELDLPAGADTAAPAITYHNRISRIVAQSCLECHRTGGTGPFPLATYADVKAHKGMIKKVVEAGTMPPWFADLPKSASHSPFKNDRSLTAEDKSAFASWIAAGMPEGDAADAPRPRIWATDWAIGKPDLVVQLPKGIPIKAEGTIPYQNITVETNEPEDRWIQALEIRPTAPAVVHHVLVFANAGEEKRGFFAAYVPGNDHQIFPAGFAKKLPKGAKLRFQIHYTPNGKATEDQLKMGMIFAKEKPKHELLVTGLANPKIVIPAGNEDYPDTATMKVPFNAVITSMMPHMHLRGKACKYEYTGKDGKTVTLLDVPHYDFNWQLKYQLAEPIQVKPGDVLKYTARYDNSAKNPANPDPTKDVRWGQQTYEEMMLGYIEFYIP